MPAIRSISGWAAVVAFTFALVSAVPARALSRWADGRIAYVDGNDGQVYSMNPDGSDVRPVTSDPDLFDDNPRWSPDGGRIAFEASADSLHFDIVVIDADGTHQHDLTPGGVEDRYPTWSPDGTRLAFVGKPASSGVGHIFVIGADGTHRRRVTTTEGPYMDTAWSPRGDVIAFVSEADGGLHLTDLHGHQRRIFDSDGITPHWPRWSPDGRRLVFTGFVYSRHSYWIYSIRADGTGLRRLTSEPAALDWNPVWSPSGALILFSRAGEDLATVHPDGSGLTNVTNGSYPEEAEPDWQRLPAPS